MFLILKITVSTKFLKLYLKNKKRYIVLFGDFHINLLNYNDHQAINNFLDSLVSNAFILYILHPTRINNHSKTLLDNMFSNFISPDIISSNVITTKSDHLPNFDLYLIFCQILLLKNPTIMKETGQNLNKKIEYLTILIKIGLTYSKLINKLLIFLWILF